MSDYNSENNNNEETDLEINDSESTDFVMEVDEVKQILDEEPNKDIIAMTEVDTLSLKNLNLQTILADKNIENLQLKQTILLHEKQDVINQIKDLKLKIQIDNKINMEDYAIDLPNKRLVHKKLLQQK